MIGEPNVPRVRNLIKLYVLQALRDEPRVERVLRADVLANMIRRATACELTAGTDSRRAHTVEPRGAILAGGWCMSYAAEPYVQFVDDLLTALTGGVTREDFASWQRTSRSVCSLQGLPCPPPCACSGRRAALTGASRAAKTIVSKMTLRSTGWRKIMDLQPGRRGPTRRASFSSTTNTRNPPVPTPRSLTATREASHG